MKTRIPLVEAEGIAQKIVAILSPACERIEIAGSIRRKRPDVGDIEIVAIPKMLPVVDMFGATSGVQSALDIFDYSQLGKVVKGGSKYKKIENGIDLDLFIVTPPAQWGVLFMIRTGSADFSHKMVTIRKYGGYLLSNCKVKDGAVWRNGAIIPMDEEEDYFKLCGIEYVAPRHRI
jgi:DNA polymerase/3'-5' exonuclease PolX